MSHTVGSDGNRYASKRWRGAAKALGYEYLAITDHSSGRNIGRIKKWSALRVRLPR